MPKIQKVGKGGSYLGAFFAFSGFVVIAIIALAVNMGPTNLKQEAAGNAICSGGGPYVRLFDCKNFECASVIYCARHNTYTGKWTVSSTDVGTYDQFSDRTESIKLVGFPAGYTVRFYDQVKFQGSKYITTSVSKANAGKTEGIQDLSIFWRVGVFDSFANKLTSFKSL